MSRIKDLVQFLKTLTFQKITNGMLLRLSYFLSNRTNKIIRWGKPESLSIEPTNLCNLKCPECPSGNNTMQRPRLFLSEASYQTIIDEAKYYLSFLQLYFQGEPFLHPKIYDFISFATRRNIYTASSTNGQFLSYENCLKIVDSGLHRLVVSIDGTDQQTFEKYRVGGSLDLATQGIENLLKAKKVRKKSTPYTIIQFVVFKTNEHQIPVIKNLARKLGANSLVLKSPQLYNYENGHPLMPINPRYNRYKKSKSGSYVLDRKKKFKCQRIWNGAVVSANEQLLPCCFDKDGKHAYGTTSEKSLLSIWKNKSTDHFIQKVWTKNKQIAMCKNCTEGLKQTWFKS